MSTIRLWCVTANHGDYGMDVLHSRIATDKEQAIEDCLDEVIQHVQNKEKERLRNDTDKIVNTLLVKNNYLQNETGLRMVAELQEIDVEMSFSKTIKRQKTKSEK